MSFDDNQIERIDNLIDGVLDAGYEETALPTLKAITSSVNSGLIADDLDALDKEVERLVAEELPFTKDNPALRTLITDLEPVMDSNGQRIGVASPDIQINGVSAGAELTKTLALFGAGPDQVATVNAAWNVPDPEAVNALVGYVQSDAWREELEAYGPGVVDTINNHAIIGIVKGQGAITTARQIRQMTESLPTATADNLMRTLQIQSYQSAAAQNQIANSKILRGQTRLETLDHRICLSCVAEHGRIYPTGEKIIDHHKGRATSIPMVIGREGLVDSGVDWFNGLPEEQQEAVAGPANLKALQAGAVTMNDYRQEYDDPVFGQMQREASLSSIIGDENAQEFYTHG